MKVQIKVRPFSSNMIGPNIKIWWQKTCIYTESNILDNKNIQIELENIQPTNQLIIEHHDKNPLGLVQDVALEIEEIKFNNVVLPRKLLYNQVFISNWKYGDAPTVIFDNCYLGYNGAWVFSFPNDPLIWIMNFLENEMFGGCQRNEVKTVKEINTMENFKKEFLS